MSESSIVITVRIDRDLNDVLEKRREGTGMSKAEFIRTYLEKMRFLKFLKKDIYTLEPQKALLLPKNLFQQLLNFLDDLQQARFGEELARQININANKELAEATLEDKLNLIEQLGLFPKEIDAEKYILVSKDFGPQKFVEAFMWCLFGEKEFKFFEKDMESNKKLRSQYKNEVIFEPERYTTSYCFKFAQIPEEEQEE